MCNSSLVLFRPSLSRKTRGVSGLTVMSGQKNIDAWLPIVMCMITSTIGLCMRGMRLASADVVQSKLCTVEHNGHMLL